MAHVYWSRQTTTKCTDAHTTYCHTYIHREARMGGRGSRARPQLPHSPLCCFSTCLPWSLWFLLSPYSFLCSFRAVVWTSLLPQYFAQNTLILFYASPPICTQKICVLFYASPPQYFTQNFLILFYASPPIFYTKYLNLIFRFSPLFYAVLCHRLRCKF